MASYVLSFEGGGQHQLLHGGGSGEVQFGYARQQGRGESEISELEVGFSYEGGGGSGASGGGVRSLHGTKVRLSARPGGMAKQVGRRAKFFNCSCCLELGAVERRRDTRHEVTKIVVARNRSWYEKM